MSRDTKRLTNYKDLDKCGDTNTGVSRYTRRLTNYYTKIRMSIEIQTEGCLETQKRPLNYKALGKCRDTNRGENRDTKKVN